jgi:hypothetical protein
VTDRLHSVVTKHIDSALPRIGSKSPIEIMQTRSAGADMMSVASTLHQGLSNHPPRRPLAGVRHPRSVYQSHLAEHHRLPTWSIVVSISPEASSALRAWQIGDPPRVDALLIDVDSVPKSPWLDDPAARPTAAVLVAVLHGFAGDFDAARRVSTRPERCPRGEATAMV